MSLLFPKWVLAKNFHGFRYPPNIIQWRGTWRSSFLSIPDACLTSIDCSHLFSDVLYRPFFCSHISLHPYTSNIPSCNQIPKLSNLSAIEYSTHWTNKPFILTEPVHEWPAYCDWSTDFLVKRYGEAQFRAEAVDWNLNTYVDYMFNNRDENPLYLFDRSFVEKMNLEVEREIDNQFWVPKCFGEDLFTVLGLQRPDHRWLIIGPPRSGSTFHKDPNGTRFVRQLVTFSLSYH